MFVEEVELEWRVVLIRRSVSNAAATRLSMVAIMEKPASGPPWSDRSESCVARRGLLLICRTAPADGERVGRWSRRALSKGAWVDPVSTVVSSSGRIRNLNNSIDGRSHGQPHVATTGTGTLAGVHSTRRTRPVTQLGCWLKGPWPADTADPAVPGNPTGPVSGSSALEQVAGLGALVEESGFDSLWVTDQVSSTHQGGSVRADPEAYSLLGALATRTRSVRLGAIPLDLHRRPPSLVAKIVTGIDVISHGRGILTYGLGPGDAVRGARVIEALRVGRALLEDESPTFEGTFYTVVDAMNRPGPVQDGGVPVVVFIEDHSDLATVAMSEFVGLADAVIVEGALDEVRQVVDEVASIPVRRDAEGGEEFVPPQVIGIGSVRGGDQASGPTLQLNDGSSVAQVVDAVRDLFRAGVDGCIVPMDLTTSPEGLAAVGEGLRDIPVDPVRIRGTGGGGT
jgi:alkanesulfonate monooxygenase SsuD/methylene tetrahydromethanopterin reductase-like flavin-dependent oxidoreductase (luciferase family)